MKKKISWWESKYSDYTHLTEDDSYVTLHVKPNKCHIPSLRLHSFIEDTKAKGKVLKMRLLSADYVVMPLSEYNEVFGVGND